jgi:glycosyltransferase involved in cell wall biosynthesis
MHFSSSVEELGRPGLRKVVHLLALTARAVGVLLRRRDLILYYPPGSTLAPLLRDIAFLTFTRPLARATVLHFHAGGASDFLAPRPLLGRLARWALGGAEAAVELGPSATPDGVTLGARRVFRVPYGIDAPPVRREREAGDGTVRVLFVGLHTEGKGIRIVLESARRLLERGLDCAFHLVGEWCDRPEEARSLDFIARHRLEPRIVLHGRLVGAAKWQAYADADVFFFPTFYEAEQLPLVLLEAMACSLPVVTSWWRCIPDVVEDGVTGLLCEPRDVDGAVEALARLVGDAPLRGRLGLAGRGRYEERYTLARHLRAMEEVFRAVAAATELPGDPRGPRRRSGHERGGEG